MSEFPFEKIDKNKDWQGIFAQLDANFEKVTEYLSTIGNRVSIESFEANANQADFSLAGQYNTTRNCLAIYKNGVRQWLGENFIETSSSSFSMIDPCREGDKIVAVYNKYYVLNDTAPMDSIVLQSPNGNKYRVTIDNTGKLVTNLEE